MALYILDFYKQSLDKDKLRKDSNMKTFHQVKIKRTTYNLIKGHDGKYHVTRNVGHKVHYLFSTKIFQEAIKEYQLETGATYED